MKHLSQMIRQKIYRSLILCVCCMCLVWTASAQESTTTIQTQEVAVPTTEDSGTRVETIDTHRKAFTTQVQDRLINLIQNVQTRIQAAITRMDNITGRINSRITKMKAVGIDTTAAESSLGNARNSLTGAKATLASLSSPTQAIRGDTPKESFQTIKIQLGTVRDLLKETHRYLRETVSLLKTATPTAGSTPEGKSIGNVATETASTTHVQ